MPEPKEGENQEKSASLDAITRMVRDAWHAQFSTPPVPQEASADSMWPREVFDDKIVVEAPDGMWAYPYALDDDGVTFGEPEKVEIDYKPAKFFDDDMIIFGGEVKALGDGKVGGYLVRFTDETEPDIVGDFFDATTKFGDVAASPVYYNHGLDSTLGLRTLGEGKLEVQDAGMWIEAQLELRDEYERAVYALAEKGKLGWSSGTAPHLVQREQKGEAWHVKKWPLGLDASLTPTPADPGNRALPLKSWAEMIDADGLKAVMPEEGSDEEPSATATAEGVTVNVHVHTGGEAVEAAETPEDKKPVEEATTEVETMSEETKARAEIDNLLMEIELVEVT